MPRFGNDLTGKKFNKWTVLRRSHHKDKSRDWFWMCRCECGLEKPVKASYLRSGTSRQCAGCAHEASRVRRPMPISFWTHLNYSANRRELEISITQDHILQLLEKQENKCALSGLPIEFASTESEHKAGKTTASVDRIDSDKGYLLENIQMVHKIVNMMKNTLSQEEFLFYCESIARTKALLQENSNESQGNE
jgi:hypothetical protein